MWSQLEKDEKNFDDISRGKPDAFLYKMFKPGSLIFEFGDDGLFFVEDLVPKCGATLHHAIFNKEKDPREIMAAGKEVMDFLFQTYQLNRISTYFPVTNRYAARIAVLVGFKWEGELRKAYPYHGEYINVQIYGILRSEFLKKGVS